MPIKKNFLDDKKTLISVIAAANTETFVTIEGIKCAVKIDEFTADDKAALINKIEDIGIKSRYSLSTDSIKTALSASDIGLFGYKKYSAVKWHYNSPVTYTFNDNTSKKVFFHIASLVEGLPRNQLGEQQFIENGGKVTHCVVM